MKRLNINSVISGLILFSAGVVAQPQVGDYAPDFTVTDTHGHTHTLSEYTGTGQFVMLDFFFTTCTPCQYYTPQISLAYETYGCNEGDIVVLGIDYNDSDAEVLQYEQTYGGIYPSASGLEGGGNAVVAEYGIVGYPFVCLIDSMNTVVEIFDPPTMQVFSYYFELYGIEEMECNTGIYEIPDVGFMSLSPNPVQDILKIEAPAGCQIIISNADGREVVRFNMTTDVCEQNVSELNNGIYFIRADFGRCMMVSKLVVVD